MRMTHTWREKRVNEWSAYLGISATCSVHTICSLALRVQRCGNAQAGEFKRRSVVRARRDGVRVTAQPPALHATLSPPPRRNNPPTSTLSHTSNNRSATHYKACMKKKKGERENPSLQRSCGAVFHDEEDEEPAMQL